MNKCTVCNNEHPIPDPLPQCNKCGSSYLWLDNGRGVCCNPECDNVYSPAPQEAPETKETAMHALESLTPGGSEFYQDVARCKEWIQDRINTNWELAKKSKMEANSIRAAADKMAEALRLAQELLERNGIHRPELDAALRIYQKAVGR